MKTIERDSISDVPARQTGFALIVTELRNFIEVFLRLPFILSILF